MGLDRVLHSKILHYFMVDLVGLEVQPIILNNDRPQICGKPAKSVFSSPTDTH